MEKGSPGGGEEGEEGEGDLVVLQNPGDDYEGFQAICLCVGISVSSV